MFYQYLEENWPLDDGDLERMHKLYRLVTYRRCSRWAFQIFGKGKRRPFPSCAYSRIRESFALSDGIYTHFKYFLIHYVEYLSICVVAERC